MLHEQGDLAQFGLVMIIPPDAHRTYQIFRSCAPLAECNIAPTYIAVAASEAGHFQCPGNTGRPAITRW